LAEWVWQYIGANLCKLRHVNAYTASSP